MIEIISDIQEQSNPFELLEESPAKKSKLDNVDESTISSSPQRSLSPSANDGHIRLKCLSICKSMLENSQEVCGISRRIMNVTKLFE